MADNKLDEESLKRICEYFELLAEIEAKEKMKDDAAQLANLLYDCYQANKFDK
jgi:hypothetical protein